jgi:mycothione reductase
MEMATVRINGGRHYDLVIIGTGSGNSVLDPRFADQRVAIVEKGTFGGTCLNVGCIPTKMFVHTADIASYATHGPRYGVDTELHGVRWADIRDRVFGRIDPRHERAKLRRVSGGVDVITGHAAFVGPRTVEVNGARLSAEQIVIATGSHPHLPAISGLESVPFHTSDTIMRLDQLPRSMVIIGGGVIAAEMGHVFGSFGTAVSIVARTPQLLPAEDPDIAAAFTALAADRFALRLGSQPVAVRATAAGIEVALDGPGGAATVSADVLLVATGRHPATESFGAQAAGLELDEHGRVVVDRHFQTSVPGVWALGDAVNDHQLKHLANAQMRVVAHNLVHPEALTSLRSSVVPHAVFTEPQVAAVGLTETEAREQGLDVLVATRHYSATAYGWALEDTTSFVKVLADRATRRLLGAHIIGPQAALLLQPLVQAMMLDQTVDQVARGVFYIHPALSEVVEQALLML